MRLKCVFNKKIVEIKKKCITFAVRKLKSVEMWFQKNHKLVKIGKKHKNEKRLKSIS